MNALILKAAACLAMLLDHIGYRLYDVPGLREIGRIAFPIFAYMIASGASKTRNIYRYLLRLIGFGFVSELIYDLYFFEKITSADQNVMFTLALGLMGIICVRELKYPSSRLLLALLPTVFFGFLADCFHADYGAWGVWLVVLFYLFDKRDVSSRVMTGVCTLLFASRYVIVYFVKITLNAAAALLPGSPVLFTAAAAPSAWEMTQIYAFGALIFISLYNGKRGVEIQNKINRLIFQYSFYAFYPLHLLALWLVLCK